MNCWANPIAWACWALLSAKWLDELSNPDVWFIFSAWKRPDWSSKSLCGSTFGSIFGASVETSECQGSQRVFLVFHVQRSKKRRAPTWTWSLAQYFQTMYGIMMTRVLCIFFVYRVVDRQKVMYMQQLHIRQHDNMTPRFEARKILWWRGGAATEISQNKPPKAPRVN